MRKLSSNLMIFITVLAVTFMSGPVSADGVGGDVPFVAYWTLVEPDVTLFTTVDSAAYEANEVIALDLIRITDFDCNAKFKISATKGNWALPANYSTTATKKANGSDSALLLMVDNVTSGYPSNPLEGLAPLATYSTYTAITTVGSDIIGGGVVGETAHGVENASCDINAKILMDWSTDIVGTYSITVTLSISEVTE